MMSCERLWIRLIPSRILLYLACSFAILQSTVSVIDSMYLKGERIWSSRCLPDNLTTSTINSTGLKYLKYTNGSSHSISLPYPSWTSAMILADITYILLHEVMGYSVVLTEINSVMDSHPISFSAGCIDVDDIACSRRDVENPTVHMSIESWMMGVRRASTLPSEVQPVLLGVLDYSTDDQIFLWQETASAALGHLSLDYYRSYDASCYKPHAFFDHWTRMFELLPPELIVRCSTMTPSSVHERLTDHYVAFSGDTRTECDHNDTVWFSPACRANTSECVPLMLQYGFEMAMQFSYFYNMPLAIIVVDQGAASYKEYYAAVRASRVLFSWFSPQDNLIDSKERFPISLNFPRTNLEEWIQRIYRTGNANLRPRNYAWRHLPAVDPRVAFLGSRVTAQDRDVEAWMRRSRSLQDAGADPAAASRQIACDWLSGRPATWERWIPAACAAGAFVDPTLTQCLPCPAGSFCVGGERPPLACPLGYFCPARAAAAAPCPAGRTTGGSAAASERDCDACAAAHLPVGGSCVPAALVFPAALAPLAALLALASALLLRRRRRDAAERAVWRVKEAELDFADPPQVLGGGSQGVVLAATYRGTPVAVKVFHVRDSDGDGLIPFAGRRVSAAMDCSVHAAPGAPAAGTAAPAVAGGAAAPGTGSDAALPRARRQMSTRGEYRQLQVDMAALTAIRHPCITNVMGFAELRAGAAGLGVVMEYMELGSLWDFLHGRLFRVQADTVLGMLQGVAQGMRFLHEARPPLLHGDLKSSNVLIDRSFLAKISNFGLSAYARGGRGAALALTEALYWTAPECLPHPPPPGGTGAAAVATRGGPITVQADVYSFGVIVHECLTRRSPHHGEGDPAAVLEGVRRGERALAAPPGCGVAAAALLSDCLQHDPARRPPFAELDRRLAALEAAQLASSALEGPAALHAHRGRAMPAGWAAALSAQVGDSQMQRILDSSGLLTQGAAEALLRGEKVPPERKEMVTMHFSDVVGFTAISAGMPAEKVSDMLERLFDQLDALAESMGVIKIETIGDAYLCATNLRDDQISTHAAVMARFSLAAAAAAAATPVDTADPTRGRLRIRVGLHSGPCMAGAVGRRSPKFSLYGDTINVASRMESSSLPGRVQCTARTAGLIRAQDPTARAVALIARGPIEVKGKGPMETFWVRVPDAATDPVPLTSEELAATTLAAAAAAPGTVMVRLAARAAAAEPTDSAGKDSGEPAAAGLSAAVPEPLHERAPAASRVLARPCAPNIEEAEIPPAVAAMRRPADKACVEAGAVSDSSKEVEGRGPNPPAIDLDADKLTIAAAVATAMPQEHPLDSVPPSPEASPASLSASRAA